MTAMSIGPGTAASEGQAGTEQIDVALGFTG